MSVSGRAFSGQPLLLPIEELLISSREGMRDVKSAASVCPKGEESARCGVVFQCFKIAVSRFNRRYERLGAGHAFRVCACCLKNNMIAGQKLRPILM
jgi:hypothetical protein